ncbi:GTPase family protein [Nocardia sp. alder85J]|uniref:GTPase family protein n=1 Tax=Nocardia sp. alder85J TaxID=2862949 RepID=UPI0022522ADB|nr:GTPase [Nocardia sp. alder85J]MCX4094628.1 50S ribosome-binding GTPase [Nocardia sp. alder85J]
MGVSGAGKTSTINALFKTDLPVGDTAARTKEFEAVDLSVRFDPPRGDDRVTAISPSAFAPQVRLRVMDAPGLGDNADSDEKHLCSYRRHLPGCDAILWVLAARNRALTPDRHYLTELTDFSERMVFGVNQIDVVEPADWRRAPNRPSPRQESNIRKILDDRTVRLSAIVGPDPTVIGYSSRHGYHLEQLFHALLTVCPSNRQWMFAGLKNFSHRDFGVDQVRHIDRKGAL